MSLTIASSFSDTSSSTPLLPLWTERKFPTIRTRGLAWSAGDIMNDCRFLFAIAEDSWGIDLSEWLFAETSPEVTILQVLLLYQARDVTTEA